MQRHTGKGIVEVASQKVESNTNPGSRQCECKYSSKPQPCLSFIL
jgi:hypothetical protein